MRFRLWRYLFTLALAFFPIKIALAGDMLKREPEVPPGVEFLRSLDVEGYVQRQKHGGNGIQMGRIRTRYLDPDVNAFVGMLTAISQFNRPLSIGEEPERSTPGLFWTWGVDIGIIRGRHLWEVDLMGVSARQKLGFAPAIVGEHTLSSHWTLFHRTELHLYSGDNLIDQDQGFYWMNDWWGFTAGYRMIGAKHLNRQGPHVGIRLFFNSPKIPFLFPSLG